MARTPAARPGTREKRAPQGKPAPRSDQVQSLVRALSIVNRLADADEGATLTDLAQQVGLSASTAHRLLTTLEQERYVHFDPERRLWSVGVQAFIAGNAFVKTRSLVGVARPFMRRLMEDSGETVNLAVEDEAQAIYLAQIECRQMMRGFARPGARVPLHCSGVGKALLTAVRDRDLASILHRHGLPRLTPRTLHTPAALRQDLAEARARGYALDDEEHAVGLRCVAAVVFDESESAIAAVSVLGPMARITDDRIRMLGNLVRQTTDDITAGLGGRAPHSGAPFMLRRG